MRPAPAPSARPVWSPRRGLRALLALPALAALLALTAAAPPTLPAGPSAEVRLGSGATERVTLLHEGPADYASAADVLRWLGATREWNAELNKLTLKFKGHTLRLTVDTRWAQLDDRVLQLDVAPLYRRNMVWVPLSVLGGVLPEGLRMSWDPRARRLEPAPPGGAPATGLAAGLAAGAPQSTPAGPGGTDPGGAGHGLRVVLDPGHGGGEPGAAGGGLRESDVVLSLAQALKTELEKDGALTVVLTRDSDHEVTARRRAEIANTSHGSLMVSLHADAGPTGVKGFELLTWPAAPRGRAVPVPPAALPGHAEVAQLEAWEDVACRFSRSSDSLARNLEGALTQVWPDGGRGWQHRRVLPLEGLAMPAVMVECGALTWAPDAERLGSAGGQQQLAEALASGIRRRLGRAGTGEPRPRPEAPRRNEPRRPHVPHTEAPAP